MPYSDQVDAEPVRRHVRGLLDGGMSVIQIQNVSGVNRTSIRVLVGEFPGRKPSRGVRVDTAKRLLRTRLDRGSTIDGLVPSAGTVRRLRALQALGYSGQYLAERLGCGNTTQGLQVARRALVRADTAQRVEDLYLELADTVGPSSRVRETARLKGWLPPIWWDDDDTLDDPRAEPVGSRDYDVRGRLIDDVTLPRAHRVALMTKAGLTDAEIAARIGTLVRYVVRDRLERPVQLASSPAGGELTGELDEVLVQRFMAGAAAKSSFRLPPELVEAVRRLAARGLSDKAVATQVGISAEAVLKVRTRNQISSQLDPDATLAGQTAQYGPGLRATPAPTERTA
jgi:hypothetical protein